MYWQLLTFLSLALFSNVSSLNPYTVISKTSPVVDALKGSTFEIRCDVNNRPDGISTDQYIQTRWERETANCNSDSCNQVIVQDRLPVDQQKYGLKFQASDTYFLIIKNVDENDEGKYICQLPLTVYVKVWDAVYVRVVEPPSIDPLLTSSDKTVSIGDDVELTCAAYGLPPPLIKWTRAGNGMMPGGGFVKVQEKLRIPAIKPEFRGPYICSATNDIGEDYRTINVNMDFPPQVSASPSVVYQKAGYETRLFCHVAAQPSATSVTWFVGDNEINEDDSDKYRVSVYEAAFKQTITKLTVYRVSSTETNSDIRCVATNAEGTTSTSFSVRYTDELQPIPGASSSANAIIHVQISIVSLCTLLLSYLLL